jgi:hypothetical protein
VNGSKPQAYETYYPILKVEKSGARASDSAPGRRLRLEGEDEQPGGDFPAAYANEGVEFDQRDGSLRRFAPASCVIRGRSYQQP